MTTEYKSTLSKLVGDFHKIKTDGDWVIKTCNPKCQTWFSRSLNLIEKIVSKNSYYYREAERIIKGSKRLGGIYWNNVQMMQGHLIALYQDIEDGLLTGLEYRITAQDFLDFFDHAKYYLSKKRKMEASVIAASIFEDSIKKIAKKNNTKYQGTLDPVINGLNSNKIITPTEAKKFKYFSGIRNDALHANWDNFSLTEVRDLIDGTEKVIAKYLES